MYLEREDGGGSRFNEMTRTWTSEGHFVTVLAGMVHYNTGIKPQRYKGKYIYMDKYEDRLDVIRCHVSESYNKNFLGRLWGYFSFVFSSIFAGLFYAKGNFDIILVTSPPLFVGITAYVLSIIKRLPIVFEIRDLWPESAIDTGVVTNKYIIRFAYWFESFIYKKSRMINVLTPAFRDVLITKKGVPGEKIIFVPNAADFTLSDEIMNSDFNREEFRNRLGWSDKIVLIYVGAHGVANHLIQIVETAKITEKSLPQVHFVLVGEGMQKNMLIKAAQNLKLANVQFINSVPKKEVFKYIISSDFGMSVLKKVDTFKTIYSNKTFDYMACKKPVLLLIDGVSRDLIETAKCGIYVEPENPQDFADKLEALLESGQESILEMGENGFMYAKENFDRTILAKKYISHLISVC
jgi:glycosyltransferase involved in cell wall biosynthesis